ncbi:unnamed protein product [Rotaria socialis]|uniref:VCBS repeat-containing protein n=1 Tax=Rotaria socialis TaxID=392032 RepID=A0A821I3M0_9BILA|nr:unnamed protein product [Rotaria socialis]
MIPNPIEYNYGPRYVAIGDIDNDDWLDIVVANYAADNVAVYFGYGRNSTKSSVTYSAGIESGPYMVTVGDFNNDNRLDIIVANFDANNILIFFGFETGSSPTQTVLSTGPFQVVWIHVEDLNNDSASDIVTANYGTHSVSVIRGHGNGSFSSPTTYSTGYDSFPSMVVSGDFNRDKQMDLAIVNYGTNNIVVMIGNSEGTFGTQKLFFTGSNSHPLSIALGDLNNDAILDIVVANSGNKSIGVFLGKGGGNFTSQNDLFARYCFSICHWHW